MGRERERDIEGVRCRARETMGENEMENQRDKERIARKRENEKNGQSGRE